MSNHKYHEASHGGWRCPICEYSLIDMLREVDRDTAREAPLLFACDDMYGLFKAEDWVKP